MAVYITGDMHSEVYPRLNAKTFPAQKELTKNDFVIVCGDFGIPWQNNRTDKYMLRELEKRNFTTLFLDGNHENFDLLNQYPVEEWNGGKVHRLNDSVFHLMRGQVFHLQNHTFFTFGGAASHDISDGILEPDEHLKDRMRDLNRQGKRMYRVNHVSWWKEEMPSADEYEEGMANLKKHNYQVDFVLSHDAPTYLKRQMGVYENNTLTDYLQNVYQMTECKRWYFGHMHTDKLFVHNRTVAVYEKMHQVL